MVFSYTNAICIEEEDLDAMARDVANGEDFEDVFEDVMSYYDELTFWTCDFIKEQVEIEVRKRINETLLFSQFVEKYCMATGGNWTKMIADGIERAFPEIYEKKVKHNDCSFKELVDILWEDCGVVFD